MKKLSDAVTPETPVKQADDPVSLNTEAKPSPELYVSLGLMAEQRSNFAEAERQYRSALRTHPKHLGAMLAYARLKDRQNQFDEAVHFYQQAIAAHPEAAIVYNDLGLCYARHKRLREALPQLERAVQLKPKEVLYRNNVATLLVELGDVDRAFQHLVAAHGEAVAYYNLGYLLQKKGQPKQAAVLFAKALEKDPSLVDARIWLDKLGGAPSQAAPSNVSPSHRIRESVRAEAPLPYQVSSGLSTRPTATGPEIAPAPSAVAPEATVPTRPVFPANRPFMKLSPEARRLPPVSSSNAASLSPNQLENATLPPGYQASMEGPQIGMPAVAPLPPDTQVPTHVQPLPSIGEVLVEP